MISISRGTYRLSEPDPNSAEDLFNEADTIASVILMILRNAGCVASASPTNRVWRITREVIALTGFAPPQKLPKWKGWPRDWVPSTRWPRHSQSIVVLSFSLSLAVYAVKDVPRRASR